MRVLWDYFKYVKCEFDQLNVDAHILQAAAVGSMHGNAYFPVTMDRLPVLEARKYLFVFFFCFTVDASRRGKKGLRSSRDELFVLYRGIVFCAARPRWVALSHFLEVSIRVR